MNIFRLQLLVLTFLFFSCETDDTNLEQQEQNTCRVIAVNPTTFYYDYIDYFDWSIFNPGFEAIELEYNAQNKIKKIIGGPGIIPPGQGFSGTFFTDDIFYDFSYTGNSVISRKSHSNTDTYYEFEFIIENNRIISREVNELSYNPSQLSQYTYVYSGNTIEEYEGSTLNKVLYLINGNLIKIEIRFYSANQELIRKTELIFSNYDSRENMLKGLFYIDGNFYNAFSQNNFNRVEKNTYDFDGTEFIPVSVGEIYTEFDLGESENGISNMFTVECDN